MGRDVRECGRLVYAEPLNLIYDENHNGTREDDIPFPYEDYNMAVELSIRIAERYSCGFSNDTNGYKEFFYTSSNGSLSFMGGTKIDTENDNGYLTTNYTDISMNNPETNTSECLGIESINIAYKSWAEPQVTIKFVDVRGATVMQPAEKSYYSRKDLGEASPIYRSFFTMPYPIFTLKVKGFYGKGVTYKLKLNSTSLEFDSERGSFNITANFIGYMLGVYSDIPLTFLLTAPYTINGSEYWKNQVKDGTFVFRDINGNKSGDMLKIPDLMMKITTASKSQESISTAAEGEKISNNYEEQINRLDDIVAQYPFNNWYEGKDNDCLYIIGKDKNEYNKKNLQSIVSGFVYTLSGYDYTYGTKYLRKFSGIEQYATKSNKKLERVEYIDEKHTVTRGSILDDDRDNIETFNKYIKGREDVLEYISLSGVEHFYVFIFDKPENAGSYNEFITSGINNDRKAILERKNAEEAQYKELQTSMYEKAIGFRPSIKNIFDLIFAHMETFMYCFYGRMGNIKHQLDSEKNMRAKNTFDLGENDTDVERGTNPNERGYYLPPFPAFFKEKYQNGALKKEMRWAEEIRNGNTLEEVKLVKEILAGTQLYGDTMESVISEIENMRSGNTQTEASDVNGGTPSSSVGAFLPLTTYDFVNKDYIGNPYLGIKSKVLNNENIEGDILGLFALRAFYYLCCNDTESRKEAKSFGELEALNFYKAIGDNISDTFMVFINKYADNSGNGKDSNAFLNEITSTSEDDVTKAWRFNSNVVNNSLFAHKGGDLIYNLYKKDVSGYTFYPMDAGNFESIKNDYINNIESLLRDRDYITTTNYKDAYHPDTTSYTNGKPMEGGTFVVYESRDYIKTIYNNLEIEIQASMEYLKDHKKEYGERKQDQYGSLKNASRDLRKYKNNIESKFGEKCYVGGVLVDAEEKSISGHKIKKIISEGQYSEREECYIKYPSMVDEAKKNSVFDEDIYIIQSASTNEIVAKAFIFLQSLPVIGKNGGIEEISENGLSLKARLLREGSYYWRADNMGAVLIPNGYKEPTSAQTFCGDKWSDGYESIHIVKDGEGTYPEWESPKNSTSSRREYLKNYFIEWATSLNDECGFAANEKRLTNKYLYEKNTAFLQREKNASDETRNVNMGLDINGLVTNEEKFSEASKEGRKLQKFLRNLMLSVCTTMDYYHGIIGESDFKCDNSSMKNAFIGFMKELNAIYGTAVKESNKKNSTLMTNALAEEANNPFKSTDVRLSVYLTLKTLYDKWFCSQYRGTDTWRLTRNSNAESDFDNFTYVDSFYNDIGYILPVNITKVSEWLSNCLPTANMQTTEGVLHYTGKTVYDFLYQVAADAGGMLLVLPQKLGIRNADALKDMFRPISINNEWDEDTATFIFMYEYPSSSHLGDDTSNIDMNGWPIDGDGYDLTNDEIVGKIMGGEGYKIPSFGVTYAKQNQSLFKNVTLSSEDAGVTEVSIAATQDIASKAGQGPRETTLYGQDLYRVYSSMSFKCGVEMMGNMQIMPLMYFQLNNIPLWKGAYIIHNVTHTITAGNIVTKFEGVRQNKYALPMVEGSTIIANINGNDNSSDENNGGGKNNEGENNSQSQGENNTKGDKNYQIKANFTQDFKDDNISKEKPIICLIPGHGPKTKKRREWEWASEMIDNELIPILSQMKFKDGTSFANNIQRCNKNGGNTGESGYSTREVQDLIKKYGSDKVVSVAVHWNGGAGSRFEVFINKKSQKVRDDAKRFAECMLASANEIKNIMANKTSNMPNGFMGGKNSIQNLYEGNTDGGPQLNCACVLTENWFADYPSKCNWDNDSEVKSQAKNNGKCTSGRAWMLSKEGMNIIAKVNANGIKKYIDGLS